MSTPQPSAVSLPAWEPAVALDAPASARLAAGTFKAALPTLAVVRVTGTDARTFLHGQFAADVKGLAAGQSVLSAWCSAQGRVLFLPRICALDDHFDILVSRVQTAKFVQRLRMFVLRAQVAITETADCVFGFAAADEAGLPAPGALAATADTIVLRSAATRPRCLVYGTADAIARAWDARPEPAAQTAAWTLLDIDDGIPDFDPALADQLLPQNLNLDAGPGISFTKGCYPGQEVIARLKYRGQVKSRLMRGTLGPGPDVPPGTKLYAPDDASGKTLGTVIATAPDAAGGRAVLAVVDIERGGAAPVALGAPGGERLRFAPAPGWPA
ncbi:MAG: folate-binding protein YgfZ [Gammaproteobacteria bacterium]|nr:folate-binding protein YgfZ [Gammaproteobacteria bacterium]MBI5617653.1 folate-binding protein YgfZ [Gammaproteobacteria bacterium]